MPEYLFHQNMLKFGGAAPVRNAAFSNAFQAIGQNLATTPGSNILVAGFTEVTNNLAATNSFNGGGGGTNLCGSLGLSFVCTALCYQSMLGGTEYVTIGTHPAWNTVEVGRVYFAPNILGAPAPTLQSVQIPPQNVGQLNQFCNNMPQNAALDYRAMIYAVITNPQTQTAVAAGFFHGVYVQGEIRSVSALSLPMMMTMLTQRVQATNMAHCQLYLGGDFNVEPHPFIFQFPRQGQVNTYPYAQLAPGVPPPPFALTTNAHTYDYWYSLIAPNTPPTQPFIQPVPLVHNGTRSPNCSDHSAILLQILP